MQLTLRGLMTEQILPFGHLDRYYISYASFTADNPVKGYEEWLESESDEAFLQTYTWVTQSDDYRWQHWGRGR